MRRPGSRPGTSRGAVDRNAQVAAFEVPERDVDHPEQPDRELLGAIELPQAMPEPLAPIGRLADELLAEDPVDDVGEHGPAPLVVCLADHAIVGRDPEHCRRAAREPSLGGRGATRTGASPPEARSGRRRLPRYASAAIIIRMISTCQVSTVRTACAGASARPTWLRCGSRSARRRALRRDRSVQRGLLDARPASGRAPHVRPGSRRARGSLPHVGG